MCAFTLTFDEVKMESFEIHHFKNQTFDEVKMESFEIHHFKNHTFDEVKMQSFEIHHFKNQQGSAECIKQKVMNIFPVTRILDDLKGFCCVNLLQCKLKRKALTVSKKI